VEHAGAAIVAETAPESQDILLVGFGKGLDRWEALKEGGVAFYDDGDPGLLEHDFGDPDRVRVCRMSPWEVALAALIPVQ